MRYRIKSGRAAAHRRFERPERAGSRPEKPQLPSAAALDNPYYRCYGAPRSRETLGKTGRE